MSFFYLSLLTLLVGYLLYARYLAKTVAADPERDAPCVQQYDGCDFVPIGTGKAFFIQTLNIAGLGPIFGPILGALYGPVAMLWVVLGTIFAGGVHDYLSGMLSMRHQGKNITELVGLLLGPWYRYAVIVLSLGLLVLVGAAFTTGPAQLLGHLTDTAPGFWVLAIFIYYFCATILPVDKIIGRIYPLFGGLLVFMTVGVFVSLVWHGYTLPVTSWQDFRPHHPEELPMWPLLFVTLSCGAISGFHATQSTLLARCITTEMAARPVFYGAMVTEGVIALVWVTVGVAFYPDGATLQQLVTDVSPSGVVREVCLELLGDGFGQLAILGVIALPITTGDTSFRSARLILADSLQWPQQQTRARLALALPVFACAIVLTFFDFTLLWRYLGWANQTLAAIVLWTGASYLMRHGRNHWIATVPATFMTAVAIDFILQSPIGLGLQATAADLISLLLAGGILLGFRRLSGAKQPLTS